MTVTVTGGIGDSNVTITGNPFPTVPVDVNLDLSGNGGSSGPSMPGEITQSNCRESARMFIQTGVFPATHQQESVLCPIGDCLAGYEAALNNAPPNRVTQIRGLVETAFSGVMRGLVSSNRELARGVWWASKPLPTSQCPPVSIEGIAIGREMGALRLEYLPGARDQLEKVLQEVRRSTDEFNREQNERFEDEITIGGGGFNVNGDGAGDAIGDFISDIGDVVDDFIGGAIDGGKDAVTREEKQRVTRNVVLGIAAAGLIFFAIR